MRKVTKYIRSALVFRYVMVVTFGLISCNTGKSDSDILRPNPQLAQTGISKNLTVANKSQALDIALDFIKQSGQAQGLTSLDFSDMIVTDQYVSKDTGITHIYFRQRNGGIEVFNANISINLGKDGRIINMDNSFFPDLNNAINTTTPTLSAIQAVELAFKHLRLSIVKPLEILKRIPGPAREAVISDGGISQEDIPVRLVFQPVGERVIPHVFEGDLRDLPVAEAWKPGDAVHIVPEGLIPVEEDIRQVPSQKGQTALGEREVRLAWDIEIYELSSNHYWSLRVDTETGKVLSQVDFVDSTVDSFN